MGRKSKEGIYVFVQMIHFAVHQKLTHIVKQLYSNIKLIKKQNEKKSKKKSNNQIFELHYIK